MPKRALWIHTPGWQVLQDFLLQKIQDYSHLKTCSNTLAHCLFWWAFKCCYKPSLNQIRQNSASILCILCSFICFFFNLLSTLFKNNLKWLLSFRFCHLCLQSSTPPVNTHMGHHGPKTTRSSLQTSCCPKMPIALPTSIILYENTSIIKHLRML